MFLEWFIPGANAHTNTASRTHFITHPLLGALFHIVGPFLITVENHFVTKIVYIFLVARASDFITGQTIYIDGGWTIW